MSKLCLVAAVCDNRVIGRAGDLPWHYTEMPTDMQHFRDTTRGGVVLMGKKTWDSLGVRPLPRRTNVVVTSHPEDVHGAETADNLRDALVIAESHNLNIFVIGGGRMYESLINYADEMWITHVHTNIEGDTYFPLIKEDEWSVKPLSSFALYALGQNRHTDKYPFTIKHYTRLGTNADN